MREREMLRNAKVVGALINIVYELKITSWSKKICVKISWWSDSEFKSYKRKTVLRGHEIHSSTQLTTQELKPLKQQESKRVN